MGISYSNKTNSNFITVITAVVIIAAVGLFVLLLGNSTKKDMEIVVSNTSFEVKGMFGGVFGFDKVASIELKNTIPAIGKKVNGSGLGEVQKGSFEVEGLGECKLFKLSDKGPFLYVNTNGKYVIINYKEKEKTEKLYNDLLAKWKQK